jgi:sulfonate transport system substrate-binding protein
VLYASPPRRTTQPKYPPDGKKSLLEVSFKKKTPAATAQGNAHIAILQRLSTGSICRRIVAALHFIRDRRQRPWADMRRRKFLKMSIGLAAFPSLRSLANDGVREIRIGYQKNGVLLIARRRATLEDHFRPQGIGVKWAEFSSGPPMMEAMNVGSIDYGAVGDSPPIFAQAAGAAIVYAAGQPSTNGQGILVPRNSALHSIADLKGKRIGFTKGSSAHNLVVQTLRVAGLAYDDVTPVYLTPPDAGPAFANGGIDAWAIWDPYLAIGEVKQNGRILVNAREITKANSFYVANRGFAEDHGAMLQQIIDVTATTASWAAAHRSEVATALSDITGIPLDIQTIAIDRSEFRIGSITDDIVATQQGVADSFFKLGLIPKQVVVRDVVWRSRET